MPRNKKQGIIFGGIMSYAMAYAWRSTMWPLRRGVNLSAGGLSNMTNIIFWEVLKEAAYMGILVFIFSSLWGKPSGSCVCRKALRPGRDNPYICRLLRQAAPFSHWLFGKLFSAAGACLSRGQPRQKEAAKKRQSMGKAFFCARHKSFERRIALERFVIDAE